MKSIRKIHRAGYAPIADLVTHSALPAPGRNSGGGDNSTQVQVLDIVECEKEEHDRLIGR